MRVILTPPSSTYLGAGRFTIATTNCQGTGCKRISNSYTPTESTAGGLLGADLTTFTSPSLTRGYYSAGVLAYVEVECVYDAVYNSTAQELLVYAGLPGVDNMPAWQSVYCFDVSTLSKKHMRYIKNYANSAYYQ